MEDIAAANFNVCRSIGCELHALTRAFTLLATSYPWKCVFRKTMSWRISILTCLIRSECGVSDISYISILKKLLTVFKGYVRVNSAFHAKTGCDSRVYEYLLPTYCFLPPAPKKVGEERGSENDIVMVVDNKEHYIPRSTPEEMENKRKYRIDAETLSKFREALSKFVGTSNYHNYTIGRGFKDKSCYRYIKSIEVKERKKSLLVTLETISNGPSSFCQ